MYLVLTCRSPKSCLLGGTATGATNFPARFLTPFGNIAIAINYEGDVGLFMVSGFSQHGINELHTTIIREIELFSISLGIGAYPHEGGGTALVFASESATKGLSPRRRGNQRISINRRVILGPIPAKAGEPIWLI